MGTDALENPGCSKLETSALLVTERGLFARRAASQTLSRRGLSQTEGLFMRQTSEERGEQGSSKMKGLGYLWDKEAG